MNTGKPWAILPGWGQTAKTGQRNILRDAQTSCGKQRIRLIPDTIVSANPGRNAMAQAICNSIDDMDSMLLQQFKLCSDVLAKGQGDRLNIRCNYGTGILPTLFGCELFMMDENVNELPAAVPLGSRDKVKALLDKGVPDIHRALGGRAFETAERFLAVFERYPVIGRNVAFYHPDAQGPMDVAEVVWGSEIFYAFHDEAQLLKDFLDLVTETYIAFMREWYKLAPQKQDYSTH